MRVSKEMLVTILIITFFAIKSNQTTLGYEVYTGTNNITIDAAACMKSRHSLKYAAIGVTSFYGTLFPNALSSLKSLQYENIRTDIYISTCRQKSPAEQAKYIFDNIPSSMYSRAWIFLYENYGSGCLPWWNWTVRQNCQYLVDMMVALKQNGKQVGVFVSASAWRKLFQNINQCPQAAQHGPVWFTQLDNKKSFDGYQKIGGWTTPSVKTYTTSVKDDNCKLLWNPIISAN